MSEEYQNPSAYNAKADDTPFSWSKTKNMVARDSQEESDED